MIMLIYAYASLCILIYDLTVFYFRILYAQILKAPRTSSWRVLRLDDRLSGFRRLLASDHNILIASPGQILFTQWTFNLFMDIFSTGWHIFGCNKVTAVNIIHCSSLQVKGTPWGFVGLRE
jgi:hypothetical protein